MILYHYIYSQKSPAKLWPWLPPLLCWLYCLWLAFSPSFLFAGDKQSSEKIIFNIFFLRKRKKEKEHQAVMREEDLNPVYGFYYFANGQQIDENNAEATDENQYYESWKLIFNTFEHHARVKPLKLYDLTKTMTNYFSVSSQYRKPIEASSVCIAGWTSSCIKNLQCPSKFSFSFIFQIMPVIITQHQPKLNWRAIA